LNEIAEVVLFVVIWFTALIVGLATINHFSKKDEIKRKSNKMNDDNNNSSGSVGNEANKDYTVLIDEFNYSDAMEKALKFASEAGIDDIQQSNYDKLKHNIDPTPRTPKITKAYLMRKLNTELRLQEEATKTIKGAEIEVQPEWVETLEKDASILLDYEKVGWKVRWWLIHDKGPGRGELKRQWLCFQRWDVVGKKSSRD
jgi:hypothetical protein